MLILKEGFKESRSSASHGMYSEAKANEGTYYCDCEIFCGGILTEVKRSTAFKHERAQRLLEKSRDAGLLSDMGRDSMDGLEVCY
ncbi:hypothetical protein BT69DRAFT_1280114 [Atractiella rhizophila]|nr:hypothetical protein BT69DRAFT_1280114 [Atractiella rhizophila]